MIRMENPMFLSFLQTNADLFSVSFHSWKVQMKHPIMSKNQNLGYLGDEGSPTQFY